MGRGGSTIESALRPWEDSACASRDGSCAKLGFDVKSKFAILFDDVTNCLNVWLNSGKAPLEHLLLMQHGSLKYVRVVGHPSTNYESGNFEFVGAVTDITESKRVEESLRASAADSGRIFLKLPKLSSSLSASNLLQDRVEIGIEQSNTLVRLLTPELPDGLRQNIGRDQGRRSDRSQLTRFFRISFNVRHRGIEFLKIPG